jgi:hypothetical protein
MRRVGRTVRGIAAAAAGVLLGALGAAVPAHAASGGYACPKGYFCAWANENATGSMMKTNKSMPTLGAWDNRIRAVSNQTSSVVCYYADANYDFADTYGFQEPGDPGSWSSWSGSNTISSLKFVKTERECVEPPYGPWFSQKSGVKASFGDLDGDGYADVLSRDLAGRLWFVPGSTGAGRLLGAGWNAMTAITRHGDFDGDGHEDLIATDTAGKMWLYPVTGSATFHTRRLVGAGWNTMAKVTAVGDLTGEGYNDLLATDKAGKMWLYPGNGHGNFGARKLISSGWQVMTALTGAGDMNGDKIADFFARDTSGKLWLFGGKGHATFYPRQLVSSGWNVFDSLISVGDTDGDGRNDLNGVTNNRYVMDGSAGYQGWLLLYRGTGSGRTPLRSPVQQSGDWWELNGTY